MRSLLLATATLFVSISGVSAAETDSGLDANQLGLPTTLQPEVPRQRVFISGYQGMMAEVQKGYLPLEDTGLDNKQLGMPSTITRG